MLTSLLSLFPSFIQTFSSLFLLVNTRSAFLNVLTSLLSLFPSFIQTFSSLFLLVNLTRSAFLNVLTSLLSLFLAGKPYMFGLPQCAISLLSLFPSFIQTFSSLFLLVNLTRSAFLNVLISLLYISYLEYLYKLRNVFRSVGNIDKSCT